MDRFAKCLKEDCKNVLTPERVKRGTKFCSRSCGISHGNTVRQKTPTIVHCDNCGDKIEGPNFWLNGKLKFKNKFCNDTCRRDFDDKKKISLIESGKATDNNRRILKEYLENKEGHKCKICGISDWLGKPLIMILDHIDGHSENNKLSNLRLVCSNCDSQLDTYKARNKGNGRKNRKTLV